MQLSRVSRASRAPAIPALRLRLRPLAIVLAASLAAAGSYLSTRDLGPAPTSPDVSTTAVELPADQPALADQPLADIDRAISVWTGNLQRDRADFIAAVHLAELYLARTRITGDQADIARALEASTSALSAYPDLPAAVLLRGQAHFANHDFAAAAADAQTVLDAHPATPAAIAALGDAQLELGAYDVAQSLFDQLGRISGPAPAVLARQARLLSLTGSLADARRLARRAATLADADADSRAEIRAWYHTLAGALDFQAGDLGASRSAYRAALDAWSGSAAALAGLARTEAASGDYDAAIDAYRRSAAIQPRPETLAAMGDLYLLSGRRTEADATYAKVRAVAALGLNDRQLALFEANHDGDAARAVALARADLARRHDVYAHDTLAWALLSAGRLQEADAEMRQARASGAEDAMLEYHAGMIALALGREDEAQRLLASARRRNAGFDPLQADRLDSIVAGLRRGVLR